MTDQWTGNAVHRARVYIGRRLPLPCTQCHQPVNPGDDYAVAHLEPRWKRPDLVLVPSNWGADHRKCSDASGQANVIAKAQAGVSSGGATRRQSPPLPVSLSNPQVEGETLPSDWTESVGSLPWMAELARIPADGVAPRYVTGPHDAATGSYGAAFCSWVDESPGLHPRRTEGLRWFQRVIAYRLLEHDVAGHLVWRNVLVTMARQLGKSWLLRALIVWRLQHPELFDGEEQTIVHMAHRMPTANEVWRPAARWAMGLGWHVRWANGEQLIESPEGGRWMIRAATDGVGVGFALSVIVADEGWMIPRSVIEAADPALTESVSPMLLLVSTAGDSASDLFGTYRANALAELLSPVNTLIVEWSAPRSMALDDPAGWRLASPHWSERRLGEILDKVTKLEELEFRQNYLNQWVEVAHGRPSPGLPVFTDVEWAEVAGYVPVVPTVAAVESWFGEGVAVATAEPVDAAHIGVTVTLVGSVAEAAALVEAMAPRPGVVLAGASVAGDPVLVALGARGVRLQSRAAITELRRYVDDDVIRHDGGADLADQVLAVRTLPGPDGPRVKSVERMDAVKAVVFAVEEVHRHAGVPQVW